MMPFDPIEAARLLAKANSEKDDEYIADAAYAGAETRYRLAQMLLDNAAEIIAGWKVPDGHVKLPDGSLYRVLRATPMESTPGYELFCITKKRDDEENAAMAERMTTGYTQPSDSQDSPKESPKPDRPDSEKA